MCVKAAFIEINDLAPVRDWQRQCYVQGKPAVR
jgi:hypothetical protein